MGYGAYPVRWCPMPCTEVSVMDSRLCCLAVHIRGEAPIGQVAPTAIDRFPAPGLWREP